jgi:hypothetical protein
LTDGTVRFWPMGLPVVILVAVATLQISLAQTASLTPWKGGGFGMFSTSDHAGQRAIRIVATAPDRSEEIAVSPSLQDAADRVTALPGERQLARLGGLVAARERRYGRPVESIRIECWQTEHDPQTLKATLRQLCNYVHHVDQVAAAQR